MALLLNPILDGLTAARRAGADGVHADDEVMIADHGDHWEFEFVPQGDRLGGGVQLQVAKDDFRILRIVRGQ